MIERCGGCGSQADGSTELCPVCGTPRRRSGSGGAPRWRLIALLGLLVLAIAVALWARRLGDSGRPCHGGEDVTASETPGRTAPRIVVDEPEQIDPDATPHERVGVLRHTGTRAYGDNSDHRFGHSHAPVASALRALGANAFFNEPSRPIGEDRVEVTTIAVVAPAGPLPRSVKERFFPAGRAAMVTHVDLDSGALRGGLAVNDLIVQVAGQAVRGPNPGPVALAIMRGVGRDGGADFEVIRGGVTRSLHLVKDGDRFGVHVATVPVLRVTP